MCFGSSHCWKSCRELCFVFFFSLSLSPPSPSHGYPTCHERWDRTKTLVPKPPHLENIRTPSWSLNYILHMAPAMLKAVPAAHRFLAAGAPALERAAFCPGLVHLPPNQCSCICTALRCFPCVVALWGILPRFCSSAEVPWRGWGSLFGWLGQPLPSLLLQLGRKQLQQLSPWHEGMDGESAVAANACSRRDAGELGAGTALGSARWVWEQQRHEHAHAPPPQGTGWAVGAGFWGQCPGALLHRPVPGRASFAPQPSRWDFPWLRAAEDDASLGKATGARREASSPRL